MDSCFLACSFIVKNSILLSDLMCIWAAARPQQAINEQAMAYPTDVTRQVVAAKNVI